MRRWVFIGAAVLLLAGFVVLGDLYDCPACEDSEKRALGSCVFCDDDGELNLIGRLRWNDAWTGSRTPPKRAAATHFVYVRVMESLSPLDRGSKYEDPLNTVLKRHNVGEVTGGGSQLGEPAADGTRKVEWIGVDVDLYDLDRGLPLLKAELVRLGAPEGTVLEFERDGKRVSESIR